MTMRGTFIPRTLSASEPRRFMSLTSSAMIASTPFNADEPFAVRSVMSGPRR